MNPNRSSLFVPGTGRAPNLAAWRRSGVPTRRLWRGFAARSAGVDALLRVVFVAREAVCGPLR
jgi:hypothetical protein